MPSKPSKKKKSSSHPCKSLLSTITLPGDVKREWTDLERDLFCATLRKPLAQTMYYLFGEQFPTPFHYDEPLSRPHSLERVRQCLAIKLQIPVTTKQVRRWLIEGKNIIETQREEARTRTPSQLQSEFLLSPTPPTAPPPPDVPPEDATLWTQQPPAVVPIPAELATGGPPVGTFAAVGADPRTGQRVVHFKG